MLQLTSHSQLLNNPNHANTLHKVQDILFQLPKNVVKQLKESFVLEDLSLSSIDDLVELKKEMTRLFKIEILRLPLPPIISINLEDNVKYLLSNTVDINELIKIYWRIHSISKTYIDFNFIEDFNHEEINFLEKHCNLKGVTADDLDGFKMGLKDNLMNEFNSMIEIQEEGESIYVFDLDGADVKSMNIYCHNCAFLANRPEYERSLGDLFIFLFNKAILNIKSKLEKIHPELEFSAGHVGGDESLVMIKINDASIVSKELIQEMINKELSKYSWGDNNQKFSCRVDGVKRYDKSDSNDIQARHMSVFGVPLTKNELKRYDQGGYYAEYIDGRIDNKQKESKKIQHIENLDFNQLLARISKLYIPGSVGYQEFFQFFGTDRVGQAFEAKKAIYLEERKTYINRVIKHRTIDYSGVEGMRKNFRMVSTVFSFNPIKNINAVSYPAGNLTIEYNALTILKRFFRNVLNVPNTELDNLTIENWKEYLWLYRGKVLPDNMSVDLVSNGLDIGLMVYVKRGKFGNKNESVKISKMVQKAMDGSESVTIKSESDFRHDYVFTTIGAHNDDPNTAFRDLVSEVNTQNNIKSMSIICDRFKDLSFNDILQLEKLMKHRKKEELKSDLVYDIDILAVTFEYWNNRSNGNIEAVSLVLFERLISSRLIKGCFQDKLNHSKSKLNLLFQSIKIKSEIEKIEDEKTLYLSKIIVDLICDRKIISPYAQRLLYLFNRVDFAQVDELLADKIHETVLSVTPINRIVSFPRQMAFEHEFA